MEYKQPQTPPGPPPSAPPPYTANYGPAPTPVCKSISNFLNLIFIFDHDF